MRGSQKKALMKKRSSRGAAFTGVIAASMLMLQGMMGTPALAQKTENEPLTYGELLEKIEQGEIKRLELDETQQLARVQLAGQKADEPLQEVRLLEQNPELIEALKENNVDFELASSADSTAAVGLLINLLWIVPLIALMLLFIRRSSNASSQALNFGKSRARFQMEAKTGVKFDDVAGIE